MNGENPLPRWARHILIGLGLFLAGAILAFGYSYRPLHGAMSWQIEQLEARLDERNRENLLLSDSLAKQTSVEADRIDPETLAQVKKELDQTKRVLAQTEKDLRRAKGKRKDANASAAKWRKRFKELEGRPSPVAAASPSKPPPSGEAKEAAAISAPGSAKATSRSLADADTPGPAASGSEAKGNGSQAGAESAIIIPSEVTTPSEAR